MTEVIDLELSEDLAKKPIVKQHPNQPSKLKIKKRGQLTFDDFRNIRIVEEPVVLSHNGSIDESLDAATHTNKHEKDEDVDHEDLPAKKLKSNIKSEYSNIKTDANEDNTVLPVDESIYNNNNSRPLYTLNWSPNVPLRFSDCQSFADGGAVIKSKWSPPVCVPLSYAGDIIKVLSFIVKFERAFSNDLLNLSFRDIEIGLELAVNDHSSTDIKLYQNKMNLLFCCLLRSLFNPSKGTESHSNKSFTLERFLSLKNPYGKLVGKLRAVMREWGLPREWRDNADVISTLNANGRGLLSMEPSDRIILLRCMIDWNCSYSSHFHNEIQRLTHLKGDTGFNHQTFHMSRFAMCGADNTLNSFEVLCSLMNQKLENRKKRKSHDQNKLSEINEQMKYLKNVRKSLNEKATTDRLLAAMKINEQWNKYFANELSHTPIDDPRADEIYQLRSAEFMIARIPKLGDFYLLPFRIESDRDLNNTTHTFNDMATYLENFIEFRKKGTMALKSLAKTIQKEKNCQVKLIYNDTTACLRDLLSGDASSPKTSHWFEVSDNLDSLIGFIEYMESISILEENIVDGTRKGIDSLVEFLKIFCIFVNETMQNATGITTERIVGRRLRTKIRHPADADSDSFEENKHNLDNGIDDNYDSEYFSDKSESEGNDGFKTGKSSRKIEKGNETNDQDENYSDIEIFSEPVRQLPNDSRENRNLRRNARRDLSL